MWYKRETGDAGSYQTFEDWVESPMNAQRVEQLIRYGSYPGVPACSMLHAGLTWHDFPNPG